jgi:hypothetical protein
LKLLPFKPLESIVLSPGANGTFKDDQDCHDESYKD